jgi:hypothetical protein
MKRLADRQKKGEVDLYDPETVQKLKVLDEHHQFPRTFANKFRDAGIEPDEYNAHRRWAPPMTTYQSQQVGESVVRLSGRLSQTVAS